MLLRDAGTMPSSLTDLLDDEGFEHTSLNNGSGTYSSDVDDLLAYPMVVFYQNNRAISAAEQSALDQYIQCGGVLLLTGYDSLGSPTDTRLAAVARVTTSGDYTGHTRCTITSDAHPATTGPYGDYSVGGTFTVTSSDHDNVRAGGASTQLISVDSAAKLTWAGDVGAHHGQVYYWNGNSSVADWTRAGTTQNIFLNIMAWHLHSVGIVYDSGSTPAAFTSLLESECFAHESFNNSSRTYSSSFWWLHRHPAVIFYNYNRAITADEEAALDQYVENGGMLLVTGYDSLGSPTDSRLANVCRVRTTGDGPFSGACRVTDGAHPALRGPFGTYAVGTTFTVTSTDHDRCVADDALGSTQLISVDTAAKLTYAADVGLDGRVYYWNSNSSLSDWTSAGTARNILLNLLAAEVPTPESCASISHTGADFYALPYDFFEFDLPAARLLNRAVTYGFSATPTVGAVQECVDTTGSTSASNPGGPYLGEFNATLGALHQAGFPDENVIVLADSAAVTSRLGDYDVLLFMETERCSLSADAYRATITSFVASGGRVVVTCPYGGQDVFVNDLGLFGTGVDASASTPYTTAGGAFWSGIAHPGSLNATRGWNWSGDGLVRLGWSTTDTTDLTVWGYNVD